MGAIARVVTASGIGETAGMCKKKQTLLVYLLTHPTNPNDGTDHSVHHNWRENHGDQSGTVW